MVVFSPKKCINLEDWPHKGKKKVRISQNGLPIG